MATVHTGSSPWIWDEVRQQYYYLHPHIRRVYQNGDDHRTVPRSQFTTEGEDADLEDDINDGRTEDQRNQERGRKARPDSIGFGDDSYQDYNSPTSSYSFGQEVDRHITYRFEQSRRLDTTKHGKRRENNHVGNAYGSAFRHQDPVLPSYDTKLDSSNIPGSPQSFEHQLFVRQNRKWYSIGQVIQVLWPTIIPDKRIRNRNLLITHDSYGQQALTDVQTLVVVDVRRDYVLCLRAPIYGGRDASRPHVKKKEPSILHTTEFPPGKLDSDASMPRELPMLNPLHVKSDLSLDPATRLCYSETYAMMYNVRVHYIGEIQTNDLPSLICTWSKITGEHGIARYNWTSEDRGQFLKIKQGDGLAILSRRSDDWWEAYNQNTDQTGLVPASYIIDVQRSPRAQDS